MEVSDEPRIDTTFNSTHYVTDIPLICNTVESWCDYCNTSEYDHPIIRNPNYTCSFTTEVDLCTVDDGLFENNTFCRDVDPNSTAVSTKKLARGSALLEALAIEEIGEKKVYYVLCHHAASYLAIYIVLYVLLNRKENHRLFSRNSDDKL